MCPGLNLLFPAAALVFHSTLPAGHTKARPPPQRLPFQALLTSTVSARCYKRTTSMAAPSMGPPKRTLASRASIYHQSHEVLRTDLHSQSLTLISAPLDLIPSPCSHRLRLSQRPLYLATLIASLFLASRLYAYAVDKVENVDCDCDIGLSVWASVSMVCLGIRDRCSPFLVFICCRNDLRIYF